MGNYTLLFYLLIPLGLVGFYLVYKIGKKIFNARTIVEMPFLEYGVEFNIPKDGRYSIWHKGKFLMSIPMNEFSFEIMNQETNRTIPLSRVILRQKQNGFKYASINLYTFNATEGKYKLSIVNGTIGSPLEQTINQYVGCLGLKFDPSQYFILVKEYHNPLWVMAFVWMLFLSLALLISGVILPNVL